MGSTFEVRQSLKPKSKLNICARARVTASVPWMMRINIYLCPDDYDPGFISRRLQIVVYRSIRREVVVISISIFHRLPYLATTTISATCLHCTQTPTTSYVVVRPVLEAIHLPRHTSQSNLRYPRHTPPIRPGSHASHTISELHLASSGFVAWAKGM